MIGVEEVKPPMGRFCRRRLEKAHVSGHSGQNRFITLVEDPEFPVDAPTVIESCASQPQPIAQKARPEWRSDDTRVDHLDACEVFLKLFPEVRSFVSEQGFKDLSGLCGEAV
jgi:hypothetical protein